MPKRYWVILLAFGIAAVAPSLLYSQEVVDTAAEDQPIATDGHQESGTASEGGSDAEPFDPFGISSALNSIEAAIRDSIPPENQTERNWQNQREISDLKAQQDMAWWAMWMFVATVATVLLTFAALVAILRTLHHTKRAADYAEDMVEEARKSTKAANDTFVEARRSNAIAVENARTEQRPWLRFELSFQAPFGDHENSYTNRIRSTVINDGASPALDVCVSWSEHIRILKDPDMSELYARLFQRTRTPGTEPGEIIYPSRTSQANLAISFAKQEYRAAAGSTGGGTPRLWIAIGAIYRDRHRDRWYKTGLVYELHHVRKSNGHLAMPNPENMTSFENGGIILSPTSIAVIE